VVAHPAQCQLLLLPELLVLLPLLPELLVLQLVLQLVVNSTAGPPHATDGRSPKHGDVSQPELV
jgi:hypothetical protein